jgi:hypothetical protein
MNRPRKTLKQIISARFFKTRACDVMRWPLRLGTSPADTHVTGSLADHRGREEAVFLIAEDGHGACAAFREIIRTTNGVYLGKLGKIERQGPRAHGRLFLLREQPASTIN